MASRHVSCASGHIWTQQLPRQEVITRPPLRRCSGQLARARRELARVLIGEPVFLWSGGVEDAGPHASFFIHYVLVLPSAPAWSMLSVGPQLVSEACNTSEKYTKKLLISYVAEIKTWLCYKYQPVVAAAVYFYSRKGHANRIGGTYRYHYKWLKCCCYVHIAR